MSECREAAGSNEYHTGDVGRSNIDAVMHGTCLNGSGAKMRCINTVAINVCGLLSKLKIPDFLDFVKQYEIICISESKLDQYDFIEVPGFQCFTLNRGGKKKNRSGGIALLVNEEICKYVEVLKGLSNDVLWFADLPDSAFCLVGDFNARTAGLSDLFSPDENVCNNLGLDDDLFDAFCNVGNHSFFEQSNFKWRRDRNNMDTKVNNYGKHLVQLCKNTGSIILNGRMGVNDSSGCFTCKDASVVDYALVSHALL